MRLGHTCCHRGKRVSVKLKNGQIIIGKFDGRNHREVFVDGIKIHKEDIRSFMIIRSGIVIPDGMEPDHEDRDTFNNQRKNLRVVTKSVNRHNTITQSNNTSGQRGVKYSKSKYKWEAQIDVNGCRHYLGAFQSFEEAVAARHKAEEKFGV